jgi:hypothetical protein
MSDMNDAVADGQTEPTRPATDPAPVADDVGPDIEGPEEPITERQRGDALRDLERARLVGDDTPDEDRDLLVRAVVLMGGVPSRTIGFGVRSAAAPDLTQTDDGRAVLRRLSSMARSRQPREGA